MNIIGIFGDSFGEHIPIGHGGEEWDYSKKISWMSNIKAHSYAKGGTDIQYSFLEFEKHHSKHDQIIFILTNPNRMTLFDADKNIMTYTGPGDYIDSNYKKTNMKGQFELRDMWKSISALDSLVTNVSYQQRNKLNYCLVIERIKQIRPDVKFIFGPNNEIFENQSYLDTIVTLEEKIMRWDTHLFGQENNDFRVAHLTEESHIILTRLINNWLKTNEMFFKFDIKEFEHINLNINKYDITKWNRNKPNWEQDMWDTIDRKKEN